jgi:predicted TIM-barrel fold metal-dependent hydrolase
MHNADYTEAQLGLTTEDRKELRRAEKERRATLERQRDYRLVDADQHYYEPDDCFTRHLEKRYRDEAIEVRRDQSDGVGRVYRAGKRFRRLSVAPGESAGPPGVLRDYFKSEGRLANHNVEATQGLYVPEYSNKAARLKALDEQDVEACLMLPSLGVLAEHESRENPDVWFALMRSYNRWVEEDWGYGTDGRIYGVPLVSLLDGGLAMAELDRLIEANAKVVLLRAGPVYGRSPADPIFDPFWARVQEANLIVAFHLGDFGYVDLLATQWGYGNEPYPVGQSHPFETLICGPDRVMPDTVGALILGNLFGRFPGLRFMIIELGASWLPPLLKKMDMIWRGPSRSRLPRPDEEPSAIYKRHFWISPYYEDPWTDVIAAAGASQVVFGSDWPHPEGLPAPLDMLEELGSVSPDDVRKIMRENSAALLGIS